MDSVTMEGTAPTLKSTAHVQNNGLDFNAKLVSTHVQYSLSITIFNNTKKQYAMKTSAKMEGSVCTHMLTAHALMDGKETHVK